ncbi:hypothetical protein LX32DRAFT_170323 [Colletotrichum zoysiae]|uniref:Uncharacterized protein n=1 Tax=Colletotrichum zoysiae TaxID=1216348 RepID=A0AAD9LYR0_9PEZI|nr:hypothetical protein LX32DRAFT_170323 [Colletotrichum zoysiae]
MPRNRLLQLPQPKATRRLLRYPRASKTQQNGPGWDGMDGWRSSSAPLEARRSDPRGMGDGRWGKAGADPGTVGPGSPGPGGDIIARVGKKTKVGKQVLDRPVIICLLCDTLCLRHDA